jgi:ribosomal 50S subunit-recycling heat shock protein
MTTHIEDVPGDADEEVSLAASDADMRSFVATDEETDMRLDRFLAVRLEAEGWSRARLQTLIEADAVLVNDKAAKSSLKLQPNDRVEIELSESPVTEFAPEDAPVEIIYEDDLLLVVNKPAGLVIHPGAGVPDGTLANRLAFHINRLSSTQAAARVPASCIALTATLRACSSSPKPKPHTNTLPNSSARAASSNATPRLSLAKCARRKAQSNFPSGVTPRAARAWRSSPSGAAGGRRTRAFARWKPSPARPCSMLKSRPDAHTRFAFTSRTSSILSLAMKLTLETASHPSPTRASVACSPRSTTSFCTPRARLRSSRDK